MPGVLDWLLVATGRPTTTSVPGSALEVATFGIRAAFQDSSASGSTLVSSGSTGAFAMAGSCCGAGEGAPLSQRQDSHFIDEILVEYPAQGLTRVIDQSFRVKQKAGAATPSEPYYLWYRVSTPPIKGKKYQAAITRHSADREVAEVLRSNVVQVPPVPAIITLP